MTPDGRKARASRFVEELVAALLRRGMTTTEAEETAERLRPVYHETSHERLKV